MPLLSTTALATGGIAAAAVSLWTQIKSAFSWASSFVVVRAAVSEEIGEAVSYYLYTRYRIVPSGLLHYVGLWFHRPDRPRPLLVPFRLPGHTSVYYGRRVVLFVSDDSRSMTICSLRGLLDFDAFVSDALDAHEQHSEDMRENDADTYSRFHIVHIMGREKGLASSQSETIAGTRPSATRMAQDDGPSAGKASFVGRVRPSYHFSFKHSKEDYIPPASKKPFDTLYFPTEIHGHVQQAEQWFAMRDWYAERSIPWRRGWLLHGPAGTGKSSLARALAQRLGIPLLQYHLGTLSDREFLREWQGMPTPCMVLFEDIDAVFHGRESQTEHKSLSFDTVLNALSGVDSQNGVFLVVTTNNPDLVDPALGVSTGLQSSESTRPGRIDSVIEVGLMSAENRDRMARHVLRDWPELIDITVGRGEGTSPIQFQEMCLRAAFAKLRQGDPALALQQAAE